jgi:Lamin Tail Domain
MGKWIGIVWMMVATVARGQNERYDVLISEVMADPSPVVGLPNAEYIELKNVSGKSIDLNKWKISNGTSTAIINSSLVLLPDSLVVVCSKTQLALFDTTSRILGITSFPTLINESGTVILLAPDGKTIHAMAYRASMHQNAIKADGGWSIEIMDYLEPCRSDNWQSSRHPKGGTPGKPNSITSVQLPTNRLEALQCLALSPNTLLLQLNQGGDSLSMTNPGNFNISPAHSQVLTAQPLPPFFREIKLTLKLPLRDTGLYTILGNGIRYCKGIGRDSIRAMTGMSSLPAKGDLLINELLFNPTPDGADFLEIMNPSRKVFNSKDILLATKNYAGSITAAFPAGTNDRIIFPGDHLVFTTDTGYLSKKWSPLNSKLVVKMDAMPSLPDDKGNITILNRQGEELDAFDYTDDMHFPLLVQKEGVSLERIDPNAPTNLSSTWHSAASSSQYGTPTKQNSQYSSNKKHEGYFKISPSIISPNNDGNDDFMTIHYQFNTPGHLLSALLYHQTGMLMGRIINNQLCGTNGSFHWNGNVSNQVLQKGVYILLIESISLQGRVTKTKMMIGLH